MMEKSLTQATTSKATAKKTTPSRQRSKANGVSKKDSLKEAAEILAKASEGDMLRANEEISAVCKKYGVELVGRTTIIGSRVESSAALVKAPPRQ